MTGGLTARGGKRWWTAALILWGGIAFIENGPFSGRNGSLLMTLLFWTAVIEGCIAVAAVCEVVHARWFRSVRRELLSVTPMLYLICLLFLLLIPRMDLYPWTGGNGVGIWLNKPFFILRNLAALLLTAWSGRRFTVRSIRNDEKRERAAVVYLFFFVLSQTLIAFDWVMSLEYPWYSTLFGAYFFVEALYVGLAVSGILLSLLHGRAHDKDWKRLRESLRDVATLLFGFSILWGGLCFTQFLVIWYGNIPEEVGFLVERVTTSPLREMSYLVVFAFFLVPFLVLLPRRVKKNPWIVSLVSLSILIGLIIERAIFLRPLIPVGTDFFLTELTAILVLLFFRVRTSRSAPSPRP